VLAEHLSLRAALTWSIFILSGAGPTASLGSHRHHTAIGRNPRILTVTNATSGKPPLGPEVTLQDTGVLPKGFRENYSSGARASRPKMKAHRLWRPEDTSTKNWGKSGKTLIQWNYCPVNAAEEAPKRFANP